MQRVKGAVGADRAARGQRIQIVRRSGLQQRMLRTWERTGMAMRRSCVGAGVHEVVLRRRLPEVALQQIGEKGRYARANLETLILRNDTCVKSRPENPWSKVWVP